MPDFLEKLHTAALRAKNMDVGIHDYVSVVKPPQITQERLGADNTHTSGPNQIYAWARATGYDPKQAQMKFKTSPPIFFVFAIWLGLH